MAAHLFETIFKLLNNFDHETFCVFFSLPTHVTPATENGSEKHTNGIENEPQVTEVKPKWSPRGYHYVSKEVVV